MTIPSPVSPLRVATEHSVPRAPPPDPNGRFVYGLTQPLIGVRMLVTRPELLRAAVIPAVLLAAFCAVVAAIGQRGDFLHRFYATFATLAPVPSIVLAHHYARLAAGARHALGFAHAEPCLEPLRLVIRRAIQQAVIVAIALAPFSVLLALVPGVGKLLVQIAVAAWALHWVVVEAFDSARVLHPGETIETLEAAARLVAPPWYVRWLRTAADRLPVAGGLVRRFARLCDRFSMSWREEIALIERHPGMMFGFALSTAAVLAVPILNLAFRPIVIIAAVHVLGQLEGRAEPD